MFQSKEIIRQVAIVKSNRCQQRLQEEKVNLSVSGDLQFDLRQIENVKFESRIELLGSKTSFRKSSAMSGASPLKYRNQQSLLLNEDARS